jgi:protein O-GlcNAc transferase
MQKVPLPMPVALLQPNEWRSKNLAFEASILYRNLRPTRWLPTVLHNGFPTGFAMANPPTPHQIGLNRAPSTATAAEPAEVAQPVRAPIGPRQSPAGHQVHAGADRPGGPPPLAQLLNRALALHRAGRLREAEPIYRAVLERAPKRVGALINFSSLLRATGRAPQAREMAERAVAAAPNDALAHFTLGATLRQLRRDKEAVASYEKAVELDPGMIKAWVNLAVSCERFDRRRSGEAQDKVLAAEPDNLVALNMKLKTGLQDCDFDASERWAKRLLEVVNRDMQQVHEWRILANLAYRALFVPVPSPLLLRTTDRIDQLHRNSLVEAGQLPALPAPKPEDATRRIRIAYMTPNFTDHPVGHVTLKLFPLHDRERFEVHAISTQVRRGGDPHYNKRHRHGVDFYHEFGDLPHFEMARRIRNLGIDILIDLDGYMETASTAIMVFRPCPIQVYWLGHAGGLGLSFVDYLIADDIVVPEGEERLYRETIARLPECYHVASPATVAETPRSRADCGLPEDAFVFCAFNNPEKFNRPAFDAWMKIMAAVPNGVLWVSKVKGVPEQQDMLRRQAEQRGISGDRLVFADRLPDKADHYARHQHIGLFLDTMTLNASTTALDALWSGTPLLAVRGDRFSNRISNSMLHWMGLGDMVVENMDDYVERAIHLANHPEELAAIRERMLANREATPLFQVGRFARHLEMIYEEMWARHCRSEPRSPIAVKALPPEDLGPLEPSYANDGLVRLHLTGSEVREGWKIVAREAGEGIEVVDDPRKLESFADASVDSIYACWFYQRLSLRDELPNALAAAARVLKPGGQLRVAVPDFNVLCNLLMDPSVPRKERFSLMVLLYGDQSSPERFNKVGLTTEFLAAFLRNAGFRHARRVPSFGLFNDMSSAKRFGRVIALNVLATR